MTDLERDKELVARINKKVELYLKEMGETAVISVILEEAFRAGYAAAMNDHWTMKLAEPSKHTPDPLQTAIESEDAGYV